MKIVTKIWNNINFSVHLSVVSWLWNRERKRWVWIWCSPLARWNKNASLTLMFWATVFRLLAMRETGKSLDGILNSGMSAISFIWLWSKRAEEKLDDQVSAKTEMIKAQELCQMRHIRSLKRYQRWILTTITGIANPIQLICNFIHIFQCRHLIKGLGRNNA